MRLVGTTTQEDPLDQGQWERLMWRYLVNAVRGLRLSFSESSGSGGSYRPDLHYMRGPGPKWHAKYGNLAPRISSDGPTTEPTLPGAAKHHA